MFTITSELSVEKTVSGCEDNRDNLNFRVSESAGRLK